MKNVDGLKVLLIKEIDELTSINRRNVKKEMSLACAKKGLNNIVISKYITNTDQIATIIDNDVLLKFAYILDTTLNKLNLEKSQNWHLDEYFYPAAIKEIENLEIKNNKNDFINCISLDKFLYDEEDNQISAFVKIEDIAEWAINGLLNYNFNSQREAVFKKISGDILKTPFLNERSVNEIAEEMYNERFEANTIYLNIRRINGKSPQMELDVENGAFKVAPLRDEKSDNETYIDVNDGFHRVNAAVKATTRARVAGKELKKKLLVCIKFLTEEDAGNFLATQEKRNLMSKSYTKTLETNDKMTNFVNLLSGYGNLNNNIFKENISKTTQEVRAYKKLTCHEVVDITLRTLKINVNNNWENRKMAKTICEETTLFFDFLKSEIYENEKELKDSIFYNYKMSAIYIGLALKGVKMEDNAPELYKILNENAKDLELFKTKYLAKRLVKDAIEYILNNIERLAS